MKIRELFENFPDKRSTDLVEEVPFDLGEDLIYFMKNDDDFYRRHYYPQLIKCKHELKKRGDVSNSFFEDVVKKAFECYSNKFGVNTNLPESLEEEEFNTVCEKLKAEEIKNINDKIY
jgi:hypothetical protein